MSVIDNQDRGWLPSADHARSPPFRRYEGVIRAGKIAIGENEATQDAEHSLRLSQRETSYSVYRAWRVLIVRHETVRLPVNRKPKEEAALGRGLRGLCVTL